MKSDIQLLYSRYNPPFTPWFLRRNEIWLQLSALIVQFTTRGMELMQRSFALFDELECGYAMRVGKAKYMKMKRALRALGEPTGRISRG